MQITPIKNYYAPKFVTFKSNEKPIKENKQTDNYSRKEVCGAVLATALSATILTGTILRGKNKAIKALAGEVEELKDGLRTLEKNNSEIIVSNSALSDEVIKLRAKLKDLLLRGDDEVDVDLINALRMKIKSGKLSYNPTNTPVMKRKPYVKKENGFEFDSKIKTGPKHRVKEVSLEIPKIKKDGRFVFELPMPKGANVEKCEPIEFTPMKDVSTSISEKYADAVQWDNDKIARDILQNFYDGHGQSLDGVRFEFTPVAGGKYRVRISGKSTYTPDKAVYIGESTKRENSKAAGNYGEGLKMAALKLLRDKGADSVVYSSGNWKVDYNLAKGSLSDRRVLTYSLNKTDYQAGNSVEFCVDDFDLLESFRKSINRFKHSSNTHFANLDFENDIFGLKILPKGQKGGIYVAGQKIISFSRGGGAFSPVFCGPKSRKCPAACPGRNRSRGHRPAGLPFPCAGRPFRPRTGGPRPPPRCRPGTYRENPVCKPHGLYTPERWGTRRYRERPPGWRAQPSVRPAQTCPRHGRI